MYFYYTDHPLSKEMSEIISEGFNIKSVHVKEIQDIKESGFFYGILRNSFEGMKFLNSLGKTYYYVDHGYIRNVDNVKYYRICKNSRFLSFFKNDLDNDRFKKLNINLNYEENKGEKIIIFEPSPYISLYYNFNQIQWVEEVKNKIKKISNREIIVKKKKENYDVFKNMYVLVHHASMGAIEALIKNIPIITLGDFFLEKIYNNEIKDIENLKNCEIREKIFNNLSYGQYSLEEIKNGTAKEIMKNLGEYND